MDDIKKAIENMQKMMGTMQADVRTLNSEYKKSVTRLDEKIMSLANDIKKSF